MLTLLDINRLTDSHDGDIYSDLYKDVYGSRPRGQMFDSIEAFNSDFLHISKLLDEEIESRKIQQQKNIDEFEIRLNEIMYLTENMNREDTIRIFIQAEGLEEEVSFYGYNRLEFELNIPYGYIENSL